MKRGLTFLFILFSKLLFAGVNEHVNVLDKNDLAVNSVIQVDNFLDYYANSSSSIYVNLYYGRELSTDVYDGLEWELTIDYSIRDDDGIEVNTNSVTIDNFANLLDLNAYTGIDYNSESYSLKIDNITVTSLGSLAINGLADLPEDIHLELGLKNEVFKPVLLNSCFELAGGNSFICDEVYGNRKCNDCTFGLDLRKEDDQILLYWSYLPGAEEYDLEWVFIDKLDSKYNDAVNAFSIIEVQELFEYRDPVRVITSNNFYFLNKAYPEGILLFRVRGNGRFIESTESKYPSSWIYTYQNRYQNGSMPDGTEVYTEDSRFCKFTFLANGSGIDDYADYEFENDKTWQLVNTYAEDGKSKTVASFVDESSRVRQTVTNLSTDGLILAAESKYDNEGRPVVNVLPNPIETNKLDYKPNLNVAPGGNSFNKSHFDEVNTGINDPNFQIGIDVIPISLSTTSGASKYYSINNGINSINRDYIPDGGGFVYTQTRFKRDNTGRPERQSGIGETHSLFNGHDTRFLYAGTNETELRRLFGSNVGDASHYKKVYTQDPNGQYSVSYSDQLGRTIATALTGPAPQNFISLEGGTSITANLVDNNIYNEQDQTIIAHATFVNLFEGNNYSFEYDVNALVSNEFGCHNCKYEILITLLDPDGFAYPITSLGGVSIGDYSVQGQVSALVDPTDPDCTGNPYYSSGVISFDALLNQIGEYKVTKTLSLIQNEFNISDVDELTINNVLVTYDEFLQEYLDAVDISQCAYTCEQLASLQGLEEGTTAFDAFVETCNADAIINSGVIDSIVENECEALFTQMKAQVSPGDYYYDNFDDYFSSLNTSALALFQSQGFFLKSDGTPATYNEIKNSSLFIVNNWDEGLARLHPEFCHYTLCQETADSRAFNLELSLLQNWTEANDYNSITEVVAGDDLIFNIGGTTYDLTVPLTVKLHSYYQVLDVFGNEISNTKLSIEQFCLPTQNIHDGAVNSGTIDLDNNPSTPDIAINTLYENYVKYPYLPANVSAAQIDELQWQNFRAMYFNAKTEVLNDVLLPLFCNGSCFSDGYLDNENLSCFPNQPGPIAVVQNNDIMDTDEFDPNDLNSINTFITSSTTSICSDLCEEKVATWFYELNERVKLLTNGQEIPLDFDIDADGIFDINATIVSKLTDICNWKCSLVQGSANLQNNSLSWEITPADLSNSLFTDLEALVALYVPAYSSISNNFIPVNSANTYTSVISYNAEEYEFPLNYKYSDALFKHSTFSSDRIDSWMMNVEDNCPDLSVSDISLVEEHLFNFCANSTTVFNNEITFYEDQVDSQGEITRVLIDDVAGSIAAVNTILIASGCIELMDVTYDNCYSQIATYCGEDVLDYFSAFISTPTYSNADILSSCFNNTNNSLSINPSTTVFDLQIQLNFESAPTNACGSFVFLDCHGNVFDIALLGIEVDWDVNASNPGFSGPTGFGFSGISFTLPNNAKFNLCNEFYMFSSDGLCFQLTECSSLEGIEMNGCIDFLYNEAIFNAQQDWNELVRESIFDNDNSYTENCFNERPEERFICTYYLNEYHYTLYYYDQSGNLVQTVPPEGFVPFDIDANGDVISNDEHHLLTNYRYNSLNQVIWQRTPDGGETNFWYDDNGMLRLSQNAEQLARSNQSNNTGDYIYSFTKYDQLGRIKEVGEVLDYPIDILVATGLNLENVNIDLNKSTFPNEAFRDLSEQTFTNYGEDIGIPIEVWQDNLRSRVAVVENTGKDGNLISTIRYSYDEHGNVKELHQNINGFDLKTIDYYYDLVSGNVNRIVYQKDMPDQFIHRYEYDADNRLTNVYTSQTGINWDEDAEYFYYAHGPLARVEIGEDKIQGLDYYYTIQGWLKGINTPSNDYSLDLGDDGLFVNNGLNQKNARDEFALGLVYFQDDYNAISLSANLGALSSPLNNFKENLWLDDTNNGISDNNPNSTENRGLYNGNISAMISNIAPQLNQSVNEFTESSLIGMAYQYDQLNRIKGSRSYHGYNGNIFSSRGYSEFADLGYFDTDYSYDANGNIDRLKRSAKGVGVFDEFVYNYNSSGGLVTDLTYILENNKLRSVNDVLSNSSLLATDIDNQDVIDNYDYDHIGNLTKDESEEIEDIKWTVYGKVSEVIREQGSAKPDLQYLYDAMGNRIVKIVKPRDIYAGVSAQEKWTYTYYSRDASGNILSTYLQTSSSPGDNTIFINTLANNFGISYKDYPEGEVIYQNGIYAIGGSLKTTSIENNIYGSSRLGVNTPSNLTEVTLSNISFMEKTNAGWSSYSSGQIEVALYAALNDLDGNDAFGIPITEERRLVGEKFYELSNHLGNVNVVISDRRLGVDELQYAGTDFGSDLATSVTPYSSTSGTVPTTSLNGNDLTVTTVGLNDGLKEVITSAEIATILTYGVDMIGTLTGDAGSTGQFVMEAYDLTNNQVMASGTLTGAGSVTATIPFTTYVPPSGEGTPYDLEIRYYHTEATSFTINSIVNWIAAPDGVADYYLADVVSATDYYPFGMVMPGRKYTKSGGDYRFGFQGQEKNSDLSGVDGGHLDFKYRIHDARLGRFLSVDPLATRFPYFSQYAFSGNRVIDRVELEGLEPTTPFLSWGLSAGYENKGDPYGYGGQLQVVDGWQVYSTIDNEGNAIHSYYNYLEERWIEFTPGSPTCLSCELDKIGSAKFVVDLAIEQGHTILDGVGMVPGIGEPADAVNAVWYTAEGDYVNAALSSTAVIPFLGWAATGTKFGLKVSGKFITNGKDFYKAASKLKAAERVGVFIDVGKQMAKNNGWIMNVSLMRKNGARKIFTDPKTGLNYALDTQHGAFEILNKKGKHMGEIDFTGTVTKEADTSGAHDIIVK